MFEKKNDLNVKESEKEQERRKGGDETLTVGSIGRRMTLKRTVMQHRRTVQLYLWFFTTADMRYYVFECRNAALKITQ